jgi:hypothetical protein
VVSLVAGIATTQGVDAPTTTSAAIAETENNYLKPAEFDELAAARKRRKDCKSAQCQEQVDAEINQWQEIGSQRHAAMNFGCRDNPAQCTAISNELRQDIQDLETQLQTLSGDDLKKANANLARARNAYYTHLEARGADAQKELEMAVEGFGAASMSPDELVARGALSEEDGKSLEDLRERMGSGIASTIGDAIADIAARGKVPPRAANAVGQIKQNTQRGPGAPDAATSTQKQPTALSADAESFFRQIDRTGLRNQRSLWGIGFINGMICLI